MTYTPMVLDNRTQRDMETLADLTEKEKAIADAAMRIAWDKAGDWLTQKQTKAEQFPGGDLAHSKGRADAYKNAALQMYLWAIQSQQGAELSDDYPEAE